MPEPSQIRAGTTAQWTATFDGYDPEIWDLTYHLASSAGAYQVLGTADGAAWSISVPPATTATYTVGEYEWRAVVSDGTDIFEVGAGRLRVLPALGTAQDLRSTSRIALDAIDAVLERRATKDQEEMSIAGRSLRRMSVDDLMKLRGYLVWRVRQERAIELGETDPNAVRARFTRG